MSASTAKKLIARLSAVLAATVAAGAATATFGTAAASAATTSNWVMTGWTIHQLDQLNPAIANHFFNSPGSYATGPNTGIYINATTPTLAKTKSFLHAMQIAGY